MEWYVNRAVLLFVVVSSVTYAMHAAAKAQTQGTSPNDAAYEVVVRQLDGPVDHNHCTTRQFQHMSFHHQGVWFVFYSDGKDFRYQTSVDSGTTWVRAEEVVAPAPNGSSSFDVLQAGEAVYVCHAHYPLGRYDVNAPYARDPAQRGNYTHEGRIKKGLIQGRTIQWSQDVVPGFTPDYGNFVQGSDGFFWIFTRENQWGTAHRSNNPNDIESWGKEMVCVPIEGRHALDAAALDDGRLYVVSMLTTDGRLYGNLYENGRWGDEARLLADNLSSVAGDDRRMAIQFDPTRKRLHLVYVDSDNRLRYRHLDAPYRKSDWQPALSDPGMELQSNVFTAALSVDSSSNPHELFITYGVQKHVGSDKRRRTGELYARRFASDTWQGDPFMVSQPGTIHNWYPNVNRDAKNGLCVLYSRSLDSDNLGVPLSVMVGLATAGQQD